ncbi:ATP-binding cassette sub- G member 1 [Cichlidogyrus casuarinus]|uniref:ATP-binding cassette sub- G member 1 n=1 Tax=Cichlidogyrus casuarinus TaxID=1844966 RepID=A0ABD2Q544_9PLAT
MEVACGEHGDCVRRLASMVQGERIEPILKRLVQMRKEQERTEEDHRNRDMEFTKMVQNGRISSSLQLSTQVEGLPDFRVSLPDTPEEHLSCEPTRYVHCIAAYPGKNVILTLVTMLATVVLTFPVVVVFPSNMQSQSKNFAVSHFRQFLLLTKRTLICMVRDNTLFHLRLISHILVGLLIGLLYFRIGNNGYFVLNNAAFLFFCNLFVMFTSLMPTVMTFPLEMNVFVKEHLNHWYSLKAYYLAKTVADIPFQVGFPVLYAALSYFMTEQPADLYRFWLFIVMLIMTSLVAQSTGLVIGAATKLDAAVYLGPITGIPILLFSGFFVNLSNIPKYLQWIAYISYTRYSFEGSLLVILPVPLQSVYAYNRSALDCSQRGRGLQCFPTANFILGQLSMEQGEYYVDLIVLCIFFLVLRVLCFWVLRYRIDRR